MARHSDEDEIGPRRPRWPQPKDKIPVAVAIDQKPRLGALHGNANLGNSGPRITATGRGAVAEQILQIAFAEGVPVREDPDLVELLSALELDAEVPIDAIAAVAEILSYIYRANGRAETNPAGTGFPGETRGQSGEPS